MLCRLPPLLPRLLLRSAWVLLAWPAMALGQQHSGTMTITVSVTDSASVPILDADVAITLGLAPALGHAVTNGAGRATLSLARTTEALQLTVRKLGFQRAYQFFTLTNADSLALDVRLVRTVVTLAPVTVSAAEDLKRTSYHLDAEQIEKSSRAIIDGTDIFKLRPDMMNSRGGSHACEVPYTPRDGWVESVWVNGQRVTLAPVDSQFAHDRKVSLGVVTLPPRPQLSLLPPSELRKRPMPPPPAFTAFSHLDSVLSILRGIRPEHIAEVTYHDCFDTSINKNHGDLAMFIVLKPGVGYKDGVGSYVADAGPPGAPAFVVDSLERYRFRVLGVFDLESGDPLAGVDVVDAASGNRAKTTATGTVSLFFLPPGLNTIQLRRDGYRDTTDTVVISPTDTTPVTLVMHRRP